MASNMTVNFSTDSRSKSFPVSCRIVNVTSSPLASSSWSNFPAYENPAWLRMGQLNKKFRARGLSYRGGHQGFKTHGGGLGKEHQEWKERSLAFQLLRQNAVTLRCAKPAACSSADPASSRSHELALSRDFKVREHQQNLLQFIKANPGLLGGGVQGSQEQEPSDGKVGVFSRQILVVGGEAGGRGSEAAAEGNGASVNGESGSGEGGNGAGGNGGAEDWMLEWCSINGQGLENLFIGSVPSSAEEMEEVLKAGGFDAVVVLLHPCEVLALNINMSALGKAAEDADRLFLQCPVLEGAPGSYRDHTGLGAVDVDKLKDALRTVTALVKTGQKTLLCCTCGTTASALVALCYMTFVLGMPLKGAVGLLKESAPGASPPLMAWDEARVAWSTLPDSSRLAKLADVNYRARIEEGREGSASEDWLTARQQLIVEVLNEQAQADIALAKVVTRTGAGGGAGVQDADLARSPSALLYQSALENMANAAAQEEGMLRREVEAKAAEAARLAAELEVAKRQLAEAQVAVEGVEAVAGQPNELQAFLAQTALESALRQETDAKEKISSLEIELAAVKKTEALASERLTFLERETIRLRSREEASRKEATAAKSRGDKLASRLERAEASREAMVKQAGELEVEVILLKEQNQRAQETEAEFVALKDQVVTLEAQLKRARDAAASATDRSKFLMRQVTELKSKLDATKAPPQVKVVVTRVPDEESAAVIAQLRAELLETKEKQLKAEKERDAALEQVSTLTVKLQEMEEQLVESSKKLLETEDRVAFLLRQVDSTKTKRRVAEGALVAARQQVKRMSGVVDSMRQRLFKSSEASSKTSVAAEGLISTAEQLYARLEQHAKRLQSSIISTDEATARLEMRQKEGQAGLSKPPPPITSLAESVPSILAAAQASAAAGGATALSGDQEKLLKDVSCLREAVEVLDAGKAGAEGEEAPGKAVGLFSELVKGVPQGRVPDGVGVRRVASGQAPA